VVALANVALLLAIGEALWVASPDGANTARVWGSFAPGARALVLVVYAWAAFHKLNADWFDPTVSCAAVLMDDWTRLFPVVPGNAGAYAVAPWAGIVAEAAIPALLFWRRGRSLGLLLALAFHLALGTPRFFNFSAIMLALLYLFVPPGFADELLRWGRARLHTLPLSLRGADRRRIVESSVYVVLALFACLAVTSSPWSHSGSTPLLIREVASGVRTPLSHLFQALWFPYYIGAVIVFMIVVWRTAPDDRGGRELLHLPRRVLLVVPVLALLIGALPYVGLRTEGAFAMFSNLRTEGGASNHLLIRATVDPFGLQTDLVRVRASNDPQLAAVAARGLSIPALALRRYIAGVTARGADKIWLEYERGGERLTTRDVAGSKLGAAPGVVVSKLLAFRPIEATGAVKCRH